MKTIKENLKTMVREIREMKGEISLGMRNGKYMGSTQWDLECKKSEFRHQHIAYCMLRGKTYNEIENYTRPGNEPNMNKIEAIMETMKAEILERNPEMEAQNA